MAINKPTGKTPEDIIYEDIDDYNRVSFAKKAEAELINSNKQVDIASIQTAVKADVQKYQESFRNYYYTSQILTDPKSNQFFQEAIKEIHPTVKIKTPARNILRLVSKVFLQQLAECCFEVMSKTNSEDVDQQVVQDAYRLLDKRSAKKNKFGKLFGEMH